MVTNHWERSFCVVVQGRRFVFVSLRRIFLQVIFTFFIWWMDQNYKSNQSRNITTYNLESTLKFPGYVRWIVLSSNIQFCCEGWGKRSSLYTGIDETQKNIYWYLEYILHNDPIDRFALWRNKKKFSLVSKLHILRGNTSSLPPFFQPEDSGVNACCKLPNSPVFFPHAWLSVRVIYF